MISRRKRILIGVAAGAMVVYGLDDLSARWGVPSRPRFSTFTITRFLRVNEKFNKYYFEGAPSVQEQCVNALLPHSGYRPCWWVERHTTQTIEVN